MKLVYAEGGAQLAKNEMDKKRFDFSRKIVHLKISRDLNPNLIDRYSSLYLDDKIDLVNDADFQIMVTKEIRDLDKIKQIKKDRNVNLVIDKVSDRSHAGGLVIHPPLSLSARD